MVGGVTVTEAPTTSCEHQIRQSFTTCHTVLIDYNGRLNFDELVSELFKLAFAIIGANFSESDQPLRP